ncbi:hypothetical protein B5X24_HaOG215302 [Helicoverpa armigera]|uniref:Uncharacterized protein n=1 Tax=Helicoverpa armigera TaxID=29058 RepID=A0A2W1B5K5_HELAM|nr:hypothetical protein B5X24_HaOG215302 [Helicoverpa armigera]
MNILESVCGIANVFFKMLKRRTSKRFVLGENAEPQSFDDEEPTEVLPNLAQKFQMTLSVDPEEREGHEEGQRQQDGRLLRPPNSGTLQLGSLEYLLCT